MIFPLSLCTDGSLGKLGKHFLPHQTLMELLVEKITSFSEIDGGCHSVNDISTWSGVAMNESYEVIEIFWPDYELMGSIDFCWIPASVGNLDITTNELHGKIDLRLFPESLHVVFAYKNIFFGPFDLTCLPSQVEVVDVSENNLSGSVALHNLPRTLEELYLSKNGPLI